MLGTLVWRLFVQGLGHTLCGDAVRGYPSWPSQEGGPETANAGKQQAQ